MKKSSIIIIVALLAFSGCGPSGRQKAEAGKGLKKVRSFSTEMYPDCWDNEQTLQQQTVHSGFYASRVDASFPYSFAFSEIAGKIDKQIPKTANVDFWVLFPAAGINPSLVVSVDSLNKNKFWISVDLKDSVSKVNEWKQLKCFFNLPKKLYPEDRIKIYVWGKDNKEMFVDDLNVVFGF